MIDWDQIPYFKMDEFSDPKHPMSGNLMDEKLIFLAVQLRMKANWPMSIHAGMDVEGTHGHSKKSYHLKGMAFDFHFKTDASLNEQFYVIKEFGFTGIGIYPEWNNPGFHLDIRPKKEMQLWKQIKGKYIYFL
jgi:hypothetical protein